QAVRGLLLQVGDALVGLGAALGVVGAGAHRLGGGRAAGGRAAAAARRRRQRPAIAVGAGAGDRPLRRDVLVAALLGRVLAEVDLAVGVGPLVDLGRRRQRQAAQQQAEQGLVH